MSREYFDIGYEGHSFEEAVTDVIADGAKLCSLGLENVRDIHLQNLSAKIYKHGEQVVRDTARMTALAFDISPHAASEVLDRAIHTGLGTAQQTAEMKSSVAACMVRGFLDARRPELAATLFELRVTHPRDQARLYRELLSSDPGIE